MRALALAALVGVLHVHHAPSHDSDASFDAVLEAAFAARLDFLVLTEHADPEESGAPLPAAEHAGRYPRPQGGELLVLVGAELGTADGHLLAYGVPRLVASRGRSGREVIEDVHAAGGFAVVPHPFTHSGWRAWDAPFDGIEVHNNASAFRRITGPLLPFRILRALLAPRAAWAAMLVRPDRELELLESLAAGGRRVAAFSGADAHRNVSVFGRALDPYARSFGAVQTVCPDGALEPASLWSALRSGACAIRYQIHAHRAAEAREVRLPSGAVELQLDGGARVLEIRGPIIDPA